MSKGVDAVYRRANALRRVLRDALGDEVDATNGVENPHFVPRADSTVGTQIAVEGRHVVRAAPDARRTWLIDVLAHPLELRAQVVAVQPVSC